MRVSVDEFGEKKKGRGRKGKRNSTTRTLSRYNNMFFTIHINAREVARLSII